MEGYLKMIIQISSIIFAFIVIGIIAIDAIPQIKDWLGRIRIGRFEAYEDWSKRLAERGLKWVVNTPKIKVTDNTRLVVLDMLKGNYSKSAIQHWQEASLLLGLSEYLKYSDDSEVKSRINKYLVSKFDDSGQWINKPSNVDGAILAYAVMKLNFINNNKYKNALDYTFEMIKQNLGEDGTIMYRSSMKNYRYVDTIGFICPFLICYGIKYGNEESIDLAVKQISSFEKHGMYKDYHIPVHAYDIENNMPLGLYGWGRGLGWFAIGLIDTWSELPVHHKYKSKLEKSVIRFAEGIIHFQQNDGSWKWIVTRGESNTDSSATATLCWFLLNAAKIDAIAGKCNLSSEKAIRYLMKVTRRNGAVDFSQGDTKDIGVYSTIFNILPFTQGFCIRSINFYLNETNHSYKQNAG